MAKIHYGVKTSRKQGGPKKAKIQYGAKPDIFKYALFVILDPQMTLVTHALSLQLKKVHLRNLIRSSHPLRNQRGESHSLISTIA